MPKPSKRNAGSKQAGGASKSSTTVQDVPAPFAPIPPEMDAFTANLDSHHFYITSLDKHDKSFKRRLFTVPLMMNVFLTICLGYRISVAFPLYMEILVATLGYDSPENININEESTRTLVTIGVQRAFMFLGDFLVMRFLAAWPYNFFIGKGLFGGGYEASPVAWRRAVKFREDEIIVRRSRRWDDLIFHKPDVLAKKNVNTIEDFLKHASQSKDFRERIIPAVSKKYVTEKTGYQMLDKNWDLYFSGMIEAHALVEAETNQLEDFKTRVLVFTEKWGWLSWEVWKSHEASSEDGSAVAESAKRWEDLKESLTKIGKQNLFYRLIEVIQSETSQPGPFNTERQQRVVQKIKEEFAEQQVDFDEFWGSLQGFGLESMPGLEVKS